MKSSSARTDPSAPAQLGRGGDRRGRIGAADDAHRPMRQRRDEAQPHAGDDGERALGAGQQPAEVVAGVVLRHARQAPKDGPVDADRLEAEQLRAHRSVADDVHPAGVGGHHAADRRRVAGAEVHPDLPAGRARRGLHGAQRRTGPDRDLAGQAVHLVDLVQPQQAEHDLAAARHRSANEPGVAALRHDPHAGIGAGDEHARDLVGRRGPHDRQRVAVESARPIGLVGGAQAGIGQAVALADDLPERFSQRRQFSRATGHLVGKSDADVAQAAEGGNVGLEVFASDRCDEDGVIQPRTEEVFNREHLR